MRFASVYRQFKTLEELVEEARAVIDAKRFEDPSQGRLFIENQPNNGEHVAPTEPPRQRKTRKRAQSETHTDAV